MGLPDPPRAGTTMLPPDTYGGQTVVVTGGGTGIGKGIALEFARHGANVAIVSRKAEHREAGVKAIEALGAKAIGVEVDVRDPDRIKAGFDRVEEVFGGIDVLINNAAGNFPSPAEKMSPNGWRAVTQIVLDGTFFCSRDFALRRMAAKKPGSILSIAATYAWTGGPGTAHSAAAKAGVVNLTQSLAVEWAPDGIRVNALAPGLFLHDDTAPQMRVARQIPPENTIPAQRTGEVRELGWAAVYMCSPYAAYLSGHTLVLDGANWLRRGLRMPEFVPVRDQFPSN